MVLQSVLIRRIMQYIKLMSRFNSLLPLTRSSWRMHEVGILIKTLWNKHLWWSIFINWLRWLDAKIMCPWESLRMLREADSEYQLSCRATSLGSLHKQNALQGLRLLGEKIPWIHVKSLQANIPKLLARCHSFKTCDADGCLNGGTGIVRNADRHYGSPKCEPCKLHATDTQGSKLYCDRNFSR